MKLLKNHRGTSLVEFAIILPVLIVILFGIIEFAILLYDKAMITNASREGARAGIVYYFDVNTKTYSPYDEGQITTIVNNYLATHLISFGTAAADTVVVSLPVNVEKCPDPVLYPPPQIRNITVTVKYPYTFLVLPNFVPGLVGLNPLWLTGESTMRCE